MWKRQLFVHRTDVDDFPRPTSPAEMTHHGLRYEKHAFQVDVEDGVKILFCYVPEIRSLLEARVVDKDVDSAESRNSFLDESLSVGNYSDVRLKGSRSPLRGGDAGHHFIRPGFVFPIADCDVGAILRQTFRDRSTNSLIATRDGGHFSRKSI
jgi:hypothetical protein